MNKQPKKEGPQPVRCLCGKEPVYVEFGGHRFYCCRNCLIRGNWTKTQDQAVASWNAEINKVKYERVAK